MVGIERGRKGKEKEDMRVNQDRDRDHDHVIEIEIERKIGREERKERIKRIRGRKIKMMVIMMIK